MSDFFSGYDIDRHGDADNEALGSTEMAFSYSSAPFIHEEFDPSPHLTVENQGRWPSCTGHGGTTVLELIAGLQAGDLTSIPVFSRKFLWEAGQKLWMNRVDWNEGCTIHHIVRAMQEVGVCSEAIAPYTFDQSSLTAASYTDASKHKALNQVDIPSYEAAKRFLDGGFGGIVAGVNWTSTMAECPGTMTERMVRGGRSLGGHCIAFVGFKRDGKLISPNSHGYAYGDNGIAYYEPEAFDWICSQRHTVMRGITDLTGVDSPRVLKSWGM